MTGNRADGMYDLSVPYLREFIERLVNGKDGEVKVKQSVDVIRELNRIGSLVLNATEYLILPKTVKNATGCRIIAG